MKYLKEYNISQEGYTKLNDLNEFESYIDYRGRNLIAFNRRDIPFIKEIPFNFVVGFHLKNAYSIKLNFHIYSLIINKTADEWYYISFENFSYYRCDQLLGLKDCLEMLKNKHNL